MERLAFCCRTCLDRADGEVKHDYLATRLLLSVPEADMIDYPKPVQTALNLLKNAGLLDGNWRKEVDKRGNTKPSYYTNKGELDL